MIRYFSFVQDGVPCSVTVTFSGTRCEIEFFRGGEREVAVESAEVNVLAELRWTWRTFVARGIVAFRERLASQAQRAG